MPALTLEQLQAYTDPIAAKAVKPVYICPVCDKHHADPASLKACMQSTEEPIAHAGELVVIDYGYHWRDGDDAWVYDREGGNFHGSKSYRFWGVITAVTQTKSSYRQHALDYHARTLAVKNGHPIGLTATFLREAAARFLRPGMPPPAAVIEAAKQFVGETYHR